MAQPAKVFPELIDPKTGQEIKVAYDGDDSASVDTATKRREQKYRVANAVVDRLNLMSEHQREQKQQLETIRETLKERVVNEVIADILPDIGEYDITGVIGSRINQWKGPVVRLLKLVGCWELDVNESILAGSIESLSHAIDKALLSKPPMPGVVNEYNEQGFTPLSIAVKIRRKDFVKLLLQSHAQPDICDQTTGRTPLFHAVTLRLLDVTQLLLDADASVNVPDFKFLTPLMVACSNNDPQHVRLLLPKLPELDAQDEHGWTALHHAANANAVECIQMLLSEGADRGIKDMNKRKPIHIARFKKFGNCVSALEDIKGTLV